MVRANAGRGHPLGARRVGKAGQLEFNEFSRPVWVAGAALYLEAPERRRSGSDYEDSTSGRARPPGGETVPTPAGPSAANRRRADGEYQTLPPTDA